MEGGCGGYNFAFGNAGVVSCLSHGYWKTIKTYDMTQEKMNVTLAKAEHERAVYSESLR